nr:type II toxin-antitoxin system VapC family toxin [Candidatus Njordarchaeota archaeon]
MILLDSYGWIEYLADGKLATRYHKYVEQANEENTITPTIVIYEVYKKIKQEKGEELALEVYAQLAKTKVVPLSGELSIMAADVAMKFGLGMADAIVYASAKSEKAKLVTGDRHFKGFEDVEFIEQ